MKAHPSPLSATPPADNPPFDVESAIQAAKYGELCALIAEARARGEDFELRGAKQIALFRWKDERKFKWVFRKTRVPYTRDGVIYCLSVNTWERWQQFLEFCSVHGLDPAREADKYGFGPPRKRKE
jgi:hypothetical protein